MADSAGADIELAEQFGLITPEELFNATLRCLGCADRQACEDHLNEQDPGEIPEICRNRDLLNYVSVELRDLT